MKELNLILPQVDGKFSQGRKFPIDLKIRIKRSAGEMPLIPEFGRRKWEDEKFKVSLG